MKNNQIAILKLTDPDGEEYPVEAKKVNGVWVVLKISNQMPTQKAKEFVEKIINDPDKEVIAKEDLN